MTDTSAARNAILDRLRKAVGTFPTTEQDFAVLETKQWQKAEQVTRFIDLMSAVNTEVHRCTEDNWIEVLRGVLGVKQAGSLLYSPHTLHGKALEKAWADQPDQASLLAVSEDPAEFRDQCFNQAAASITDTIAGIADTGSLVLWPSAFEPRLMSLAPNVHVALLRTKNMRNTWLEVQREQVWSDGMPTNAVLISGPSKTSDIEQTLTYGVHGPCELVVLLVEE